MIVRRALPLLMMGIILFVPASGGHADVSPQAIPTSQAASSQSGSIAPVGPGIKIANETGLNEVSPAIAFNSMHSEYLVVWFDDRPSNDDIWAQRLTKNGLPIGLPFTIASTAGIDRRYPRVAYNTLSDQYLIVWDQQSSTLSCVCGRRVAADGLVMDPNDIVFESAMDSPLSTFQPTVAYASASNKYLVIWSETFNTSIITSIYGRSVLGTGVLGDIITISAGSGLSSATLPDLAYNPLTDLYLVVWQQLDPANPSPLSDIWGRLVLGSGASPSGDKFVIAGYTKPSTNPAVAALPVSPHGQYLVIWQDLYNPGDNDILGREVSYDGSYNAATDISISVTDAVDETQPSVSASVSRGQYLVTWKAVFYAPLNLTGIYGGLVNPTGSLSGSLFNLGGLVAAHPRVAAGPGGDFLTVFDDTPLTPDVGIYGQLSGNRVYLPIILR